MRLINETRRRAFFLLILCCVVLPQGASGQGQSVEPTLIQYKQTVNADGEAVELYLHVFYPEGWSAEDSRSAIVFFFGGGWSTGSPTQFYPHCQELAERGMVAAAAEYRVRSRHGTSALACVEDAKSAVRFLRANAQSLGIDPGRIASGGGSAGGHIAACTGLIDGFEAEGADHTISSVPNLMVLFNPALDVTGNPERAQRMGVADAESISPTQHIHAAQPPCVIFHGEADRTVPIQTARVFTQASQATGAVCVLREYEGAGHGFFNHGRATRGENHYEMTTRHMCVFLAEHGYIAAEDD